MDTGTTNSQPDRRETKPATGSPGDSRNAAPESSAVIRRALSADGVCILEFDTPGSSANVLHESILNELAEHLLWIEKQSSREVRALIIRSAKDAIFIAGADVEALYELSPSRLAELVALGQEVFNRLSDISIPTAAAIHGACMGGGLELALACDYRVASDAKSTKIALPETQLGILPSWGGCTRLPRLIGAPKALDIILSGRKLAAPQARKLGIVDALCPREHLETVARGLLPRGKSGKRKHALLNSRLAGFLLEKWIRPRLAKKTRGNYPAPEKALEVITRGAGQSRAEALRLEAAAVDELARHDATPNLIRTFLLQQRARKLTFEPAAGKPAAPVKQAAVIGAGVMGSGIAHWISSRGIPVILQDIDPERLAAGLGLVSKRYREAVSRRIFTKSEARRREDLLHPAYRPVPLAGAGIVIEAATENLDLKKKIFHDLESRTGPKTVLATNTSALPLGEISSGLAHPERLVGIHFFNPVHRMQLVEIVVPEATAPATVATALSFVKGIGKLPVIVADRPGFLVNRVLMPYLVEAGELFEAGVPAAALDSAMLDFGMPMGPLRLLDEIGLDVALDVAQTLSRAFPERMAVPRVLETMVAEGTLGKKTGRGFYAYKGGRGAATSSAQTGKSAAELRDRMTLLMVNEAARCLAEGVVAEPADADFAMIMGTGFAPFRGGPLRYCDRLGAAKVVSTLEQFARTDGSRFTPCEKLVQMAGTNGSFYPEDESSS